MTTPINPEHPLADVDTGPRIALCQEWLTTYGGSEQVALEISKALGITDVFTFTADPEFAKSLFPESRVFVSSIGKHDIVRRHWQWFLPAMARAWKSFDFSPYDVVITSSHSTVNAIRPSNGALHISYCHTPMRYAWDWRNEIARYPFLRPIWPVAASMLRSADRKRAQSVDVFIANSKNVADRISRFYGREAQVIYPPVDTSYWSPVETPTREYYLLAGRLVAYKRADMAVRAFTESGRPLVVAGSGPELARLQAMAGPSVRFEISPSRDRLRDLYRNAAALVFPGIEDFGMTMVEAQACGTPVIALGQGGALEAVLEGESGMFFHDPHPTSLSEAVRNFQGAPTRFDAHRIRRHATSFDTAVFHRKVTATVEKAIADRHG